MLVLIYGELFFFYRSVQILAYADNIDVTGRTKEVTKEACISLETPAETMHLQINLE
jgi:hypothetical protein